MEKKDVEDKVRNLLNWVAVYQEEFDIEQEAADKLREKLHELAEDIANL